MEEILKNVDETEIPPSLLVNLIGWLRDKDHTDEEIVDCLLTICKED